MTSLHVVYGLAPPIKNPGYAYARKDETFRLIAYIKHTSGTVDVITQHHFALAQSRLIEKTFQLKLRSRPIESPLRANVFGRQKKANFLYIHM